MKKIIRDISEDIGPFSTGFYSEANCKYPMYSFNRPVYSFWQGFYEGLRKRGLTHQQSIHEMQSKGVRLMLDDHSDMLQNLGREMAENYNFYVHTAD